MKYTQHSNGQEISYLMMCEGFTEAEAKREVLMQELRAAQARKVCRKVGHKWIDESYGNPESGAIDMHCGRCGFAHFVRLY